MGKEGREEKGEGGRGRRGRERGQRPLRKEGEGKTYLWLSGRSPAIAYLGKLVRVRRRKTRDGGQREINVYWDRYTER